MAWIRKQAAIRDRKTRRRRDQWIYHGIDSKTHQLVALMGEVGAARMMQATTFPTFHAMAYDFIAGGWKVDAKTTRMGKLQVRMGHERKLHANDVMACVYVDEGRTRVDFLGWIWCQEFLARAPCCAHRAGMDLRAPAVAPTRALAMAPAMYPLDLRAHPGAPVACWPGPA